MFLSNLREVVTLLAKVLPQVCPAASLEGKTGLKVFTEPTQPSVYKYFLFNFLLLAPTGALTVKMVYYTWSATF